MAEAKKENIENNNTMSLIERFKQFMAKVDWSELTIGEKEALYEATYGVPNGDGIPFKVIPDNKEETIRIIYGDEETQLKLRKSDLKKFRKWLEDTYMGKEVGEVWLSMERERKKEIKLLCPLGRMPSDNIKTLLHPFRCENPKHGVLLPINSYKPLFS